MYDATRGAGGTERERASYYIRGTPSPSSLLSSLFSTVVQSSAATRRASDMSFRMKSLKLRRDRVGRVKETGDGGSRSVPATPPLERAKTVATGLGQGRTTNDGAVGLYPTSWRKFWEAM